METKTPTKDKALLLSDGRMLSYRELGDPDGKPLFFFHGTPGSRLVLSENDRIAQIPGLRLILPERPGYGFSTPKPGRTLLDWPRDVAQLAEHLGFERFAVAGESGGGPHTLACAFALKNQIEAAFVLSSPAPADFPGATEGMSLGNRLGIWLNRIAPPLLKLALMGNVATFRKTPNRFISAIARHMCEADQKYFEDPVFRQAVLDDFREAYRQGEEGQFSDGRIAMTSRSWGFPLEEIAPSVFLWYGKKDTLVSMNMAKRLAQKIPNCKVRYIADCGHILSERPEVIDDIRGILNL